jgi:hypothetical protein
VHAAVALKKPDADAVHFRPEATGEVLALMETLAPRAGWLVLQPGIAGEAPAAGGSFGVFSGRGPMVPVCSWVPGERSRNGIEHVALGIEHGTGAKAVDRLAGRGLPVPDGWEVMQDHPKRGLVVAVPPAAPAAEVLVWLLEAGAALTLIPLTGEWRALVYRR